MDLRNPSTIRRNGVFEAYFRRTSDASASIARALEITPDDPALIALAADIYQSEGNLAGAEQMLARLPAQLPPERVAETCSRMRQLIYQHRNEAVISSLEPIVATPPLSIGTRLSEYHILLAMAKRLAGNAAAARDTYETGHDFLLAAIANSGQTQGRVHAMLGQMYAGLGQKELALREAAIAIELEGEDKVLGPAANKALARIEMQLGEKDAQLVLFCPDYASFVAAGSYLGAVTGRSTFSETRERAAVNTREWEPRREGVMQSAAAGICDTPHRRREGVRGVRGGSNSTRKSLFESCSQKMFPKIRVAVCKHHASHGLRVRWTGLPVSGTAILCRDGMRA